MPPDVVAAPVPPPLSQPRASPSSPPASMVTTVPNRPQQCCVFIWQLLLPRTAPGHSLTSKSQPSLFYTSQLLLSPPILPSQSIFLTPSLGFHPKSIKSCLILCGSSFLMRPTELLCHSTLWPPCSSFWDPLLPRTEAHFFPKQL